MTRRHYPITKRHERQQHAAAVQAEPVSAPAETELDGTLSNTSPNTLRDALLARLERRVRLQGEISFPAAPALLDVYMARLEQLFAGMGKPFSERELGELRAHLEPRLHDGFASSAHCRVQVKWESEAAPSTGLDYEIRLLRTSLPERYEDWLTSREPPLFGLHPDAKVMEVARQVCDPERPDQRILDVGAGPGRNTLPLGRAGYATDALEVTESFCEQLERAAQLEALPIVVYRGSALDTEMQLPTGGYRFVFCSEVTPHFQGLADLRCLFERAGRWLTDGGALLLNAFVTRDDYQPDELARQLSEIAWCTLYTRSDLAEATRGLPFALISDEPVCDYERERHPAEAWPPTSWFEDWARGYNCFGLPEATAATGTTAELPPMELRWLLYRKGV